MHFVKEAQIISKDSKSQAKFIHDINVAVARNYSENLREEVKKGMLEKASQSIFPGHAPFGYRNNKADRTIEIDPVDSATAKRMFELYATGAHTLTTVAKAIHIETGKRMSHGNIHLILKNRFYTGSFVWRGVVYPGTHPVFLDPKLFERVQSVLTGHNRPKYSKRDVAFQGLMTCAYDGCMVTGEIQKGKYVWWWIWTVTDASATVSLLVGVATIGSSRRGLIASTFCGACGVAIFGLTSMLSQGDHSSASLLFVLTFFVLTVSMPLFVAVLCVYDFRRA